MRAQLSLFSSAVILAVVLVAAPDLAVARGCGGGGQHANPQDEGQGRGGRQGRRNRDPGMNNPNGRRGRGDGPHGGPHAGPHGGHDGARNAPPWYRPPHTNPARRPGRHGPNVDVTIGGYGYPGGHPGPATPACAELAQMRHDLNLLWQMRRQVNSGKRIISFDEAGNPHVYSPRAHSRNLQNRAMHGDGGTGQSAYDLAAAQRNSAGVRDAGLAYVDYRIGATQDRIGQLEYECAQ